MFITQLVACGGGSQSDTNIPDTSGPDVTPPVITLNGKSSITIFREDSYVELGATAIDDRDGSVSVNVSGSVDTSTKGSYTISYTAADSAGNTSNLIRNVTVEARPLITSWKTDNNGASDDNQITIGTTGGGYDYEVDWGF